MSDQSSSANQLIGVLGLMLAMGASISGISITAFKSRKELQDSRKLVEQLVHGLRESDGQVAIRITPQQVDELERFAERNPARVSEIIRSGIETKSR